MRLGAFATRMLLGFYEYYAKITFLFFCSSVQKKEILPTLRSVRMTLCA